MAKNTRTRGPSGLARDCGATRSPQRASAPTACAQGQSRHSTRGTSPWPWASASAGENPATKAATMNALIVTRTDYRRMNRPNPAVKHGGIPAAPILACHSTGTPGFPKQERMTGTSDHVLYAAIVFLAIHLVPGTPLRAQAVRAMGEGPYRGVFSLFSAIVLF